MSSISLVVRPATLAASGELLPHCVLFFYALSNYLLRGQLFRSSFDPPRLLPQANCCRITSSFFMFSCLRVNVLRPTAALRSLSSLHWHLAGCSINDARDALRIRVQHLLARSPTDGPRPTTARARGYHRSHHQNHDNRGRRKPSIVVNDGSSSSLNKRPHEN
jgi:hypothetical protein